jgi:5-methyltetrahydrofolate--homocysteine methyltransferase
MNYRSARCPGGVRQVHNARTSRAFVVGALGTPKTASIPMNDARNTSFEELQELTSEPRRWSGRQRRADERFSTLNAKAALFAIDEYFDNR